MTSSSKLLSLARSTLSILPVSSKYIGTLKFGEKSYEKIKFARETPLRELEANKYYNAHNEKIGKFIKFHAASSSGFLLKVKNYQKARFSPPNRKRLAAVKNNKGVYSAPFLWYCYMLQSVFYALSAAIARYL